MSSIFPALTPSDIVWMPNESVFAYSAASRFKENKFLRDLLEVFHTGKPNNLAKVYQSRLLALSRGDEYNTDSEIQTLTSKMQDEQFGKPVDTTDEGLQALGFVKESPEVK